MIQISSDSGRVPWIFFDLDDTLWDFSKSSLSSLQSVYADTVEISKRFKDVNAFIDEYHIHNSALWKQHSQGLISSSCLRTERWRRTLFPSDHSQLAIDICTAIDTDYLNRLSSTPAPMDGAIDLLRELTQKYMVGCLSNGFTTTQYRKLQTSGLWRYVTRLIVSDEIGIQKPAREIFDYAITETGACNCPIMIGDNPDTDILGALKAGWRAIWFTRGNKDFPYSREDLVKLGICPELFIGITGDMQKLGIMINSQ